MTSATTRRRWWQLLVYDPEADVENPADSVFCAHGAGYVVPWDQVEEYMHIENAYDRGEQT